MWIQKLQKDNQKCSNWSYLCNKGGNPDARIDGIGEESAEDIPLSVDFPGVDFVEEGHHHKSVEDHREVDGGWSSEIWIIYIFKN